jgi:CRP-like cAMP-binding protein
MHIFDGIIEKDIDKMLNCLDAKRSKFKKGSTIINYMSNTDALGIVLSGSASLMRYDYDGNRSIIENLVENSVFCSKFFSENRAELFVAATSDCEILSFGFDKILKRCSKACACHDKLLDNLFELLSRKIVLMNEKLEVISKKTIREKLLTYFKVIQSQAGRDKHFVLPMSLTDLSDYLGIDRSAMMREIKHLNEDGFIQSKGKRIRIIE